jgi:ribosomal protein S18 acetylase RimI-like enzyme
VIVREASTGDVEAVALVVAAVAPEGFLGAQPPVDLTERAERLRRTVEGEGTARLWVLDDRGQVVGYLGAEETVPGVFSLGMAIVSQARGRGGGRALLAALEEHARSCGAHKLWLEVWTDNPGAIAFYGATGFEVEGLKRDHYRRRDGRLRSTLLMGRRLDTPGASEGTNL